MDYQTDYQINPSSTLKQEVINLGLSRGLGSMLAISKHTGLAYITILKLDDGRKPSNSTYLKLAKAFDVNVHDLIALPYN